MAHPIKLLLVLLILAIGGVVWWKLRPVSYRYLLTVTVETPRGTRIGSGVQEISTAPEWIFFPDGDSATVKLKGEAVAVQLPDRRTLFVLLSSERPGEEGILSAVQSAFSEQYFAGQYRRGGKENLEAARKIRRLKVGSSARLKAIDSFEGGVEPFWPMFVTFGDPQKSVTVRKVDPRHLDREFGPGVRLKELSVAITDEPITRHLARMLPWLHETHGGSLDADWTGSRSPTFAQATSGRDFSRD